MCLVTQGPKRHTKPGCSFVSWGSFFCVWVYVVFCLVSLFLVVSTSAIDCLERLISEMIYYVSHGTLNPTHSLTRRSLKATKSWFGFC